MKVNLLTHQYEILTSKSKYKALISGIGGGKTWCGIHWVIKQAVENPKTLGFIGATTFGQLRNSTLSAVFNEFSRLEIPFSYNQSSGVLSFLGAKALCKSLENYEPLRGIEVGYIWIDEAAFAKKEAYEVMIGRLRDKHGSLELLLTSTPNGFNWVFDHFAGDRKTSDHLLVKAKSTDNKHLPSGYIDSLRSQYDEKLLQQELMGEFVNITQGQVYYAFNDDNIADIERVNGSIYSGNDWNVDPMAGVLYQVVNGEFHIFDEVFLRNSDTYKLCHELLKKDYKGATVIPDSTGRNRKTSGKSDFDIMKEMGFTIQPTRNPAVIDRVNNVNRLLSQGRVKINPRCKKLINDLSKVTWKDGKLDQKTDHLLSHISDALGYGLWFHDPITSSKVTKIYSQKR